MKTPRNRIPDPGTFRTGSYTNISHRVQDAIHGRRRPGGDRPRHAMHITASKSSSATTNAACITTSAVWLEKLAPFTNRDPNVYITTAARSRTTPDPT